MESEIDLRPYILALIRQWRRMLIVGALLGLIGVLLTLAQPQRYTASADVLILPMRSQLEFDPRFVTNDVPYDANMAAWQQALAQLAQSGVIEDRVRASLPPELANQAYQPGDLVERIEVSSEGNLLHLEASYEDAEMAKALVDAWSRTYIRLVNDLYTSDSGLVQEVETQLTAAQERYDQAQQELETFVGSSQLVRLEQQLRTVEGILKDSREANLALYTQYLSRTHELELVLRDAETLREQQVLGPVDTLGSNLALLALRARTAGDIQLPVQLRFDDPGALAQGGTLPLNELDALITIIQQRRQELIAEAQQFAQTIVAGSGSGSALTADQRNQYEQELTELQQQFEEQTARKIFLEQRRNLALESLTILQRKLDEQRVAEGTSQVEVRLVGSVLEPLPSMFTRLLFSGIVGGMLGVCLSVLVVLGQEIIRPLVSGPPPVRERPVDQPVVGSGV